MAWMVPGQNFDKYTYAAMLSAAKIAQAWSGIPDESEEEVKPKVPPKPEPPAFDKDALLRLAQRAKESASPPEPTPPPPPRRPAAPESAHAAALAELLASASSAPSSSSSSTGPAREAAAGAGPAPTPTLAPAGAAAVVAFGAADIAEGGDGMAAPQPGSPPPKVVPPRNSGVDVSEIAQISQGFLRQAEASRASPQEPSAESAAASKRERAKSIVNEALEKARRAAEATKTFYAAASEAPAAPAQPPPQAAQAWSEVLGGVQVNEPSAPALGELRAPVSARLRAHDLGMHGDLGLRRFTSPSRSRSRRRRSASGGGGRRSRSRSRRRRADGSRSRSGGRRRPRIFSERPQPDPALTAGPATGAATTRAQAPVPQPDGGFAVNTVALAPQAGNLKRIDIQIPMALVRHFIGNKGATVRALTDAVGGGVSINVLPTVLPGGFKRIQVVGENWYQAQTLILAKLEELRQSCW